jgi:membrane complex biogenesis BtpA family protein
MPAQLIPQWSSVPKPVIGMLHLPPLPGSPRYGGKLDSIRESLLRDAQALADGGVHGLMLENFGDVPFYPTTVPAHVIAHMTALAAGVRARFDLPLGINVLRNDARAALAIAHAVGASFIRVNVLCNARVADQGIIQGIAHDLMRDRAMLGADVKIFADVDVKHSAPLSPRPLADEVSDTLHRGLADALIVSGWGTGQKTDPEHVRAVKHAAQRMPVFVGSGVNADNARDYSPFCDGFIIGSAMKRSGHADEPVEIERVRSMIAATQSA